MDDLYASDHGHEDELLEQGSSIDTISTLEQASALTNPAERYDCLSGGKSPWSKQPQSSPTSLNRSGASSDPRWKSFPGERDSTSEIRVTIWNSTQQRKISGNAAPMEKNVDDYLRKHPDCEIYRGQDKLPGAVKYDRNGHNNLDDKPRRSNNSADKDSNENQRRVVIWNRVEKRKLSGNCAPLEKNLEQYLKDNPNCEVVNEKVKKVAKKSRASKDQSGNGGGNDSSGRGGNQGDIANGHQGFVYFDPFGGEGALKGPEDAIAMISPNAMTLESLRVKPNPKIQGMVLPTFGISGDLEIGPTGDAATKPKENKTTVGTMVIGATC